MDKQFKDLVKQNFERGTLTRLESYIKGKDYRVNIIRQQSARDLKTICSIRDYVHRDTTNTILEETSDLDFEVLSENLIPGVIKRHTHVSNIDRNKVVITEQQEYFPSVPSNKPVLLVKKVLKTNLFYGYFNKVTFDVFIII